MAIQMFNMLIQMVNIMTQIPWKSNDYLNNMMPMNLNMNNMGIMMGIQNKPKMTVSFTTVSGENTKMTFDYGTSVGEILKKFLMEVGKP